MNHIPVFLLITKALYVVPQLDLPPLESKFRPSLQISKLNSSTFLEPFLPMQPLAQYLKRSKDQSFRGEDEDIGNIDYTGNEYVDEYLKDVREVRSLLKPEDEFYDSLQSPPDIDFFDESDSYYEPFYPSLPLPEPANPDVQDVDIVVKSLPGAGPRLTGASTNFVTKTPSYPHNYPILYMYVHYLVLAIHVNLAIASVAGIFHQSVFALLWGSFIFNCMVSITWGSMSFQN